MATTLYLIRHGQASFGAADYDRLSPLGHQQAQALGRALHLQGVTPDAVFLGDMRRHRETMDGIADGMNQAAGGGTDHAFTPTVIPGLNEFDFAGLINARFASPDTEDMPADIHQDRRKYFAIMRDCVLEWQRGEIVNPPETWPDFTARVRAAREEITASGAKSALAVSSGGPIGQSISEVMQAPADAMIRLQLQVINCSVSRLILTPSTTHLHGFNEVPHINATNSAQMLTYS
jgi:broad specificity phosphatase PhoE